MCSGDGDPSTEGLLSVNPNADSPTSRQLLGRPSSSPPMAPTTRKQRGVRHSRPRAAAAGSAPSSNRRRIKWRPDSASRVWGDKGCPTWRATPSAAGRFDDGCRLSWSRCRCCRRAFRRRSSLLLWCRSKTLPNAFVQTHRGSQFFQLGR